MKGEDQTAICILFGNLTVKKLNEPHFLSRSVYGVLTYTYILIYSHTYITCITISFLPEGRSFNGVTRTGDGNDC